MPSAYFPPGGPRVSRAMSRRRPSRAGRFWIPARGVAAVTGLALLLTMGTVLADLGATLSPFAGTDDPGVELPVVGVGERDLALFSPRLLAEFYAERDYRPAWDSRRAQTMLDLAQQSRADGFVPADFHAESIAELIASGRLQKPESDDSVTAELVLSDALLRYIHHFRFGKHNPRHVNRGLTFVEPADAEQLKADMAHVLATPGMADELAALLPNPDFYRNLKRGYQRYLAIADRGGWSDIPGGPNLRVGTQDARVPLIREHLAVIDGFEHGFVADPQRYDEDLAEAIKGFQRRSGLAGDGIVGPNTLRALNVPLDERLLAIQANLERMRWLYNDLPSDYLFVDLAAFELYLVRDGEEAWRTPGIIGTLDNQTPMFRDEMEYLVFNPTWTVPRSIEKKFKGVPAGYKRVRSGGQYYLVQEPGPRNALGRVKFMFPNGHAIYLHDTPSRGLFNRSRRAYSHGCVRVKEPLTLAQHVLNKPAWDQGEINRVVNRGRTRWVNLDEHLPVLLYYLTAKADEAGRVGFRQDIYGRDRRLLAMLDKPADSAGRIAFAEPQPASEREAVAEATPEGEATVAAADEPLGDVVADTTASGMDASATNATATDAAAAGVEDADAVAVAEGDAAVDDRADTGAAGGTTGALTASAASGADAMVETEGAAVAPAVAAEVAPEALAEADVAAAHPDPTVAADAASAQDTLSTAGDEPDVAHRPGLETSSPARGAPTPTAEAATGPGTTDVAIGVEAEAVPSDPVATTLPPEPAAGELARLPDDGHAQPAMLRLDAAGRFAKPTSGASATMRRQPSADVLRPSQTQLDLSAPMSVLRMPQAGSGGAAELSTLAPRLEGLSAPMADSPRIADEPPVWTLPRD